VIELIKSIILEFQDIQLETGVPRRLCVENIKGKATVCIGVRRSGKSTYIYQIIQRLLDSGIPIQNILYINFFDDRLHELCNKNLGLIVEAYYTLYPEKKNSQKVYYFFDEIQVITDWEPFIERLLRTEKCEIYLTGSSAKMLSKEIATQMRGRSLSWEIFPFSFKEYLDYKEIETSSSLSTMNRLHIQNAFENYWITGGFPEVIGLSQHLRTKIHQEYFNTMLFRDLIDRYDISHPKAVIDIAHRLANNVASLYSINKLTGYIKSLGHKMTKSSVSNCLTWFEDAYFLFTVKIFDASITRSNTNPKKIYCIDHALITSVSSGILTNSGHLLENLIFISLRSIYTSIYYYKTRSGKEVDFIVPITGKESLLVQVCENLTEMKTRKREMSALIEAMEELNIKRAFIVTKNEKESIDQNGKIIEVLPAWKFLLEGV